MPKVHAVVILALTLWLGVCADALAITATGVSIASTADCTSNANLDLGYTNAGVHTELGRVTNASGALIGGFERRDDGNMSYDGLYMNPIQTAQPNGSLIGSYALVGANPPSASSTVEYLVVYNCTTHTIVFKCSGPYGRCPQTARQALDVLATPLVIPATSTQMLAALVVLLALAGAWMLPRRLRA